MRTVTVKHFAQLREARGCSQEQVTVEPGTTLAQLFMRLFQETPLETLPVGYAQDHEVVGPDTPLVDGAEVAFLPPVGGG